MFQNSQLKEHLENSSTIKTNSFIIAEWNMNSVDNIDFIGNYRYRPLDPITSKYRSPANTFDKNDDGNFYTNATYSDITIDGGLTNEEQPVAFQSVIEKEKSLYSLEDCFGKFRPRSGINKLRFFDTKFSHHTNIELARRPRYYMAHRGDMFKYWTSYRVESGTERGISNKIKNGQYFIDDAAPYVVYKEPIPTNRLVFKMQTNVGDINLGPFSSSAGSFSDPFYGYSNQTTPSRWKVQILKGNSWVDAKSFTEMSLRSDGTNIIGSDGYVELFYGLNIPQQYKAVFKHIAEYSSASMLPPTAKQGYAFLIKSSHLDVGIYHIWFDGDYHTFVPQYDWDVFEKLGYNTLVTDLTSVSQYTNPGTGMIEYRELDYISGIRVVVETMNTFDSTFDLIEMSPRIATNISEMTTQYSITKQASDLGVSGMPVGQLLASTGTITLFDNEQAFNENNTSSIIAKHLNKRMKFDFYDVIVDVNDDNYFVPQKTFYTDAMPKVNSSDRTVNIELRDGFSYFESLTAPQIFIQNASVSYATSLLLDSIGFSNYVFKRVTGESEAIIPDFFIAPDTSVAQVLNDIAVSTQTAMFFDEYNNFIMMSKNYMMPIEKERATDFNLYGNETLVDTAGNQYVYAGFAETISHLPSNKVFGAYYVEHENGIYTWSDTANIWTRVGTYKQTKNLTNIIDLASEENKIYNDGKINYTSRYIQKTYGSIRQASLIDRDKTWVYKPALLWEVAGTKNTKSVNGEISDQSAYVLGAIPLNSTLSDALPQVKDNVLINNTVDFGEGVYWMTRYNGYFYSNGEVIKFDAVQYNIPKSTTGSTGVSVVDNNVWISSVEEYDNYFSKLSFNGKMYPTGLVRIYSEPNYEVIDGTTRLKNGAVAKHGRGQFGTKVVSHEAGINSYWSDTTYRRGCTMKSSHLFSNEDIPETTIGPAGVNNKIATNASFNGIIKNFLSSSYISETDLNKLTSTQTGTVQSSALVVTGPAFKTTEKPLDSISYVYKSLDSHYRHFGTRMRIIGRIENSESRTQTPIGSSEYFSAPSTSTDVAVNINGASGGIAVMMNPETNNGYYFEIIALTDDNVQNYSGTDNIYNIVFYKLKQKSGTTEAIPIRLWAGLTQILVDDGKFTGQSRIFAETATTVYDLAVEYENIGSTRRFYLYLNNQVVATVDDTDPLPIYNNMALFVRGSARCMFEHIYSLTNNYSKDSSYVLDTPVNSVFGDSEINVNQSFRKYAMSGMIQQTYLSGLSTAQAPKYNMYFDEFGTIMREAAYFNVRYDKAYPALYAKLSPTFNNMKGYTVSGFVAGAYGAEFMIFNATDTVLSLDESSGNYLRIQGVTFTQASQNELSVDQYFTKHSNLSDPELVGSSLVSSPIAESKNFTDIKNSRSIYGKRDFSINAPYVQSQDDADSLMKWMVSKIMKPRKALGLKVFATSLVQLGDIVTIKYSSKDGFAEIADTSRFVVYSIEYSKTNDGPEMTIYLSEVI